MSTNTTIESESEADVSIEDVAIPTKEVIADETLDDRLTDNVQQSIGPARYFKRDEDGNPVESWGGVFNRVATNIAEAEYEFGGDERKFSIWQNQFEQVMRELRFIPNSPTLMNAGLPLQQLSACFVVEPDDDMDDINKSQSDAAAIFKSGGGVGYAFHHLRPKGARVASTGGVSSGPLSFMQLFDTTCQTVKQGGKRRGAQMAIMHCQHPDIGRFAVSKRGEDNFTNFNISYGVTDEFKDAVENNEMYTLYDPEAGFEPSDSKQAFEVVPETAHFYDPEFEDSWNDDFDKPAVGLDGKPVEENFWRDYADQMQTDFSEYKDQIDLSVGEPLELPAGFIWQLLIDGAHNNGEPGIFYLDETNRQHSFDVEENSEHYVHATNPCSEQPLEEHEACLTGNQLITTDSGVRRIEDISGGDRVVSDNDITQVVTEATLIPQGERHVVNVELEGGMTITATPDHEFMTDCGAIEAQNLIDSDASVRWMEHNPTTSPVDMDSCGSNRAFTIGWMHGDGWMTEKTIGISFNKDDGDFEVKDWVLDEYHAMFGDRKPLKDDGVSYQEQTDSQSAFETADTLGFKYGDATNRSLPECFYQFSENEQLAFLRGLFTADSGIGGKADNQIKYATSSYDLADELQSVLGSFGIQTRKYVNERDDRSDQIQVRITKHSAELFMQYIGYGTSAKRGAFNWDGHSYSDSAELDVVSVSNAGTETVYDLNVPETNVFFANGALVHNCNLGHVNLSLMVDDTAPDIESFKSQVDPRDYDQATFAQAYLNRALDTELFEETIRTGVRFLDNVVTQSEFPLDEISEQVRNKRKIGLGLMGFHQMLIQMGVEYGSDLSYEIAREVMRKIDMKATEVSHELADERGVFNEWDESKWADPTEYPEWFETHAHQDPQRHPDGYAMRNHNVTTIAPTGTTSMIGNTTGGCEPIYQVAYFKNVGDDIQGDEMLVEFDDYFLRVLEANGIDVAKVKDETKTKMMNNEFDSVEDLDRVPESVGELFVTTQDLDAEQHIRMQAAFQEYCDSGISKTLNMPNDATVDEVGDAFLLALDLGIKGTTVYRDGSRNEQVKTTRLDNGLESDIDSVNHLLDQLDGATAKKVIDQLEVDIEHERDCEECGSTTLDFSEGCPVCMSCGYSPCN